MTMEPFVCRFCGDEFEFTSVELLRGIVTKHYAVMHADEGAARFVALAELID
jgi:hypothetical protein